MAAVGPLLHHGTSSTEGGIDGFVPAGPSEGHRGDRACPTGRDERAVMGRPAVVQGPRQGLRHLPRPPQGRAGCAGGHDSGRRRHQLHTGRQTGPGHRPGAAVLHHRSFRRVQRGAGEGVGAGRHQQAGVGRGAHRRLAGQGPEAAGSPVAGRASASRPGRAPAALRSPGAGWSPASPAAGSERRPATRRHRSPHNHCGPTCSVPDLRC